MISKLDSMDLTASTSLFLGLLTYKPDVFRKQQTIQVLKKKSTVTAKQGNNSMHYTSENLSSLYLLLSSKALLKERRM